MRRSGEFLLACILLALTMPLMVIVALAIKCESTGSVFERRARVGNGGRTFQMLSFRTTAQTQGRLRSTRQATKIGHFLQSTRIDALPQLFNVLRGDMSIIGPRPERPYFVNRLATEIPFYSARHCVKPGITGWAQVNAPYGASTEDTRTKLRYDLYYIKHCSFRLDVLILLRTIRVIILQEGAR